MKTETRDKRVNSGVRMATLRLTRRMALFVTDGLEMPNSAEDLLGTKAFAAIVGRFLKQRGDALELRDFSRATLIGLFRALCRKPFAEALSEIPADVDSLRVRLHDAAEELYNFWRSFERFLVVVDPVSEEHLAFKDTINHLNHLVRKAYRQVCENITYDRPRVYRQVAAGFQVGIIAKADRPELPREYVGLSAVPRIRQVLLNPPLIIDPSENKRTGEFVRIGENPLAGVKLDVGRYLMYPAKVGELIVFIYFHHRFIDLGCALGNLFELASDNDCRKKPDAVYVFGAPSTCFTHSDEPTIFFEDTGNDLLVAAVPLADRFGYFGYLKKMVLTLHNIIMMKRGRMPVHGAFLQLLIEDGRKIGIVLIGDTGTGKSESIEAFRTLAGQKIRRMKVIFDDMGSLEIREDEIVAYGTEIGAFVRLDDLSPGYALGNIDRSIIMSPHKINARLVLPITSMRDVLFGHRVDFLLYANNYEHVDVSCPILERFTDKTKALDVFRSGTAMSKGTTTSTGLTHSYFANIFGPTQYQDLHEGLAEEVFDAAFRMGIFVGQLRTRLGISGFETKGPRSAAEALLEIMAAHT